MEHKLNEQSKRNADEEGRFYSRRRWNRVEGDHDRNSNEMKYSRSEDWRERRDYSRVYYRNSRDEKRGKYGYEKRYDPSNNRYPKENYRTYREKNRYGDINLRRTNVSSSRQSNPQNPIPVDLTPSGVLTRYLHLSDVTKSLSESDTKSKYSPPDDEIVPTPENCHIHLFKYNERTDKQTEIPIYNFKSYYIIGRDKELADIVVSEEEDGYLVSKEHTVLQFRKSKLGQVNCYIMDLKSTNGTFLNDSKEEIPSKRYIELKDKDFFKLGDYNSVLEFMVVHDK